MSLSLIEELELQVIALRGNDRAHCASLVQQAVDALKARPSGVVLPERDAVIRKAVGMCNRIPGSTTWNAAEYAYDEIVARLNSSPVSAGDDETRHDAVKALHDVMQAVSCASLYSLAEAVLDAGYVKPVSAGGVDERAAVYMLKVRGMAWWREADKEAFDSAPDDRYEKLALYDRAALTASMHNHIPDATKMVEECAPNHSEQVREGWVQVPKSMLLEANSLEALVFVGGGITGDDGAPTYLDCVLWVGDLLDDDGSAIHGLHAYCTECEEEGSTTLAEFAAAPSAGSHKEQE